MLIWFSLWNLVKFSAVTSFLLVCAVRTKSAVDDYYSSEDICTSCYDQALASPGTYFEFTRCKNLWTTTLDADNLLYDRSIWGFSIASSPVSSMVWSTATILGVLVLVYLCIVCFAWGLTRIRDEQLPNEHPAQVAAVDRTTVLMLTTVLFEASSLFVILLLATSQGIFELTLSDGCYVAPWNSTQLVAGMVVETVALTVWGVNLIVLRWWPGPCKVFFFCLTRVCEVTWYATSVVLASINESTLGNSTQLIVNVALILSLADVFCLLNDVIMGVRGRPLRRRGNGPGPGGAARADFQQV